MIMLIFGMVHVWVFVKVLVKILVYAHEGNRNILDGITIYYALLNSA